jgi:hypothetical protein
MHHLFLLTISSYAGGSGIGQDRRKENRMDAETATNELLLAELQLGKQYGVPLGDRQSTRGLLVCMIEIGYRLGRHDTVHRCISLLAFLG